MHHKLDQARVHMHACQSAHGVNSHVQAVEISVGTGNLPTVPAAACICRTDLCGCGPCIYAEAACICAHSYTCTAPFRPEDDKILHLCNQRVYNLVHVQAHAIAIFNTILVGL